MQFDEFNKNRKVINVDLDGVLTYDGQFWNDNVRPDIENIKKVQELYKQGNVIIIWTARQWSIASLTVGWLITHEVPFHGIYMGKGGSDAYIDDKAMWFDKLLHNEPKTARDTNMPKCPKCNEPIKKNYVVTTTNGITWHEKCHPDYNKGGM